MHQSHYIDWKARGYHTPALFAGPGPDPSDLFPEYEKGWPALQTHFAHLRNGDFSRMRDLAELAKQAPWGVLQQYYLYLLSDAGPRNVLRLLADDALDSSHLDYPVEVAKALIDSGILSFVPDILEVFARRVEDATTLPLRLSLRLEVEEGFVAEPQPEDEYGEIYRADVTQYHAKLEARFGRDAPVIRGELFSVRRLAELFLDALKDRSNTWCWPIYRRHFEAATGLDMTDLKPLTTSAKLEAFLASPESRRFEDGVRYFWGHRIPE